MSAVDLLSLTRGTPIPVRLSAGEPQFGALACVPGSVPLFAVRERGFSASKVLRPGREAFVAASLLGRAKGKPKNRSKRSETLIVMRGGTCGMSPLRAASAAWVTAPSVGIWPEWASYAAPHANNDGAVHGPWGDVDPIDLLQRIHGKAVEEALSHELSSSGH